MSGVLAAPPVTPARILDLSWGIARTGTLTAALDLGIFGQLAESAGTAEAVAQRCGTDRRAMAALLSALAALALVETDGADEPTYRLAPDAAAFLVPGRPGYLGDLRHMHHELNFRLWPALAGAITAGGPPADLFGADGSEVWTKVTPYLDQLAEAAGVWLAAALGGALPADGRVLDAGCGSGGYSRLLARTGDGVRVTAIDRPEVITLAGRLAGEAGLAGQIEGRAGDLRDADWGDGYDVVLFANLLHGYDEPQCVEFLARAASVLRPGGRVAVFEIVPDPQHPMDNPVAAFFSLQMLMTSGGRAYDAGEYRRLFTAAGLPRPAATRCPAGPHTLLTAPHAGADPGGDR